MNDSETEPMQSSRNGFLRRALGRLRRTEAGQTLVEFALVMPVMLLMLFGLVDFGRGFYTWLVVTNAAREGARVGATQQPLSAIQTRIADASSGVDQTKLTVNVGNVQGPRGQAITVDLSYAFAYVTPVGDLLHLISGGNLSTPVITSHASMRLE